MKISRNTKSNDRFLPCVMGLTILALASISVAMLSDSIDPPLGSAATTSHTFVVSGPFESGKAIDLAGQQIPCIASFRWIEVTGYDDDRCKVHLGFKFDTPTVGEDEIVLTLTVRDREGQALSSESTLCGDARARTEPVEWFGHPCRSTGINSPVFSVSSVSFEDVGSLELTAQLFQ